MEQSAGEGSSPMEQSAGEGSPPMEQSAGEGSPPMEQSQLERAVRPWSRVASVAECAVDRV